MGIAPPPEFPDQATELRQKDLTESIARNSQTEKVGFVVNRKVVKGNKGSKPMNRSWNQLFVVLTGGKLMFFKDAQTASRGIQDGKYNTSTRSTWKGEQP